MKKFNRTKGAIHLYFALAASIVSLLLYGFSGQYKAHADGSSYTLGAGQAGYISCTQATCQSSATTFFVPPATTLYRINAAVDCTSSTATATAILIIKYTDPGSTIQTITLATATCTTLGSLSVASLDQGVTISSGTNVQYNVTTANSPIYQARVAVYQEGMN